MEDQSTDVLKALQSKHKKWLEKNDVILKQHHVDQILSIVSPELTMQFSDEELFVWIMLSNGAAPFKLVHQNITGAINRSLIDLYQQVYGHRQKTKIKTGNQ